MASVAAGGAGELAVDARAGAARADPGRSLAGRPDSVPADADCRRPRPARTERLRSWPMPLLRTVAADLVEMLGESAIPAWREFTAAPHVGPHARYALYARDQGPEPG